MEPDEFAGIAAIAPDSAKKFVGFRVQNPDLPLHHVGDIHIGVVRGERDIGNGPCAACFRREDNILKKDSFTCIACFKNLQPVVAPVADIDAVVRPFHNTVDDVAKGFRFRIGAAIGVAGRLRLIERAFARFIIGRCGVGAPETGKLALLVKTDDALVDITVSNQGFAGLGVMDNIGGIAERGAIEISGRLILAPDRADENAVCVKVQHDMIAVAIAADPDRVLLIDEKPVHIRRPLIDAVDLRRKVFAAPFADQFAFLRFAPETVDSFELGYKAALLDGDLLLSLAGFLGKYKDVQIPGSVGADLNGDGINESFIGITTNAADANVNGIEFEGSLIAGRNFAGLGSTFSLNWAFGYLDAKFNEYIDAFGNDVADQRVFQNTPDTTANLGFNLGLPMAGGIVDFIGSVSMRSDTSQFEVPNEFLDQEAFALVDASIVYTADSGLFSIGVHGKNLLDKEYIVAGYNFVAGGFPPGTPFVPTLGLEGTLTGFYGDPRRFYVTAEVNF